MSETIREGDVVRLTMLSTDTWFEGEVYEDEGRTLMVGPVDLDDPDYRIDRIQHLSVGSVVQDDRGHTLVRVYTDEQSPEGRCWFDSTEGLWVSFSE